MQRLWWYPTECVTTTAALVLAFAFWPIEIMPQSCLIALADGTAANGTSVAVSEPQRGVLLNVEPTVVDPVQFVPEPLRQPVGETPIATTLAELPEVLEERFGVTALLD